MWEVVDKDGRVINSFYREEDARDFRLLRQLYECRIVYNKKAKDIMYPDIPIKKKEEK